MSTNSKYKNMGKSCKHTAKKVLMAAMGIAAVQCAQPGIVVATGVVADNGTTVHTSGLPNGTYRLTLFK